MNSFIAELKRRNVFRVAIFYAVAGWIAMQLGVVLETSLNLPSSFDTIVTVIVLLGFPVALILAWLFEMTPQGVKRTIAAFNTDDESGSPGKALYVLLAVSALLAVTLGVFGWMNLSGSQDDTKTAVQMEKDANENASESLWDFNQSIAVLPFEDISQGEQQAYFARGISEELLNALARVKGLRVASRSAAFSLRDDGKSLDEIASKLSVAHILEGSIQRYGDTVRVSVQLIDTNTNEQIWTERYDRPFTTENLFDIQDEIAAAIVDALKVNLTVQAPEAAGRSLSLEVYDLYLQSRANSQTADVIALRDAEAGFKKVINLDPGFAPGYSGLADTYLTMRFYSVLDSQDALRYAAPNVEIALELDPNSPEALSSAAYLAYIDGKDIKSAIEYAKRAIEVNPSYLSAYIRQGQSYSIIGDHENALAAYQKALIIDPTAKTIRVNIQRSQYRLGDLEGARSTAASMIRNHPDSSVGYLTMGDMYNDEGKYVQAHEYWKEAQARDPELRGINERLVQIYLIIKRFDLARSYANTPRSKAFVAAVEGRETDAREHISTMRRPSWITYFYYLMGDIENAFESAQKIEVPYSDIDEKAFENNARILTMQAKVLRDNDFASVDEIISALDVFFEDRAPEDIQQVNGLSAGFRYHMLKGDMETAMLWIDRMHELGIYFLDLDQPLYKDQRDEPQFVKRLTSNEALRIDLASAINKKLENAPPHWVRAGE